MLSLLICSALSEQCSASLLCCFSFPHPHLQSLSIQGEPQGIQWQLNTFLWIDFKALFPLGPSGRGSEGKRGKEGEALHVTLCIAVPDRAWSPQFNHKEQQLAVVCTSPVCWSQDAGRQLASRSYCQSNW